MPDKPASREDFIRATRNLEASLYPKPEPIVEAPHEVEIVETPPPPLVDDSVTLADRLFEEPDRISGLPKPEPDDDDFPPLKFIERVDTTWPGGRLDPDKPLDFVELGPFGRILLGPIKDQDEVDQELANSYNS